MLVRRVGGVIDLQIIRHRTNNNHLMYENEGEDKEQEKVLTEWPKCNSSGFLCFKV